MEKTVDCIHEWGVIEFDAGYLTICLKCGARPNENED